jgi:hypothetical protein
MVVLPLVLISSLLVVVGHLFLNDVCQEQGNTIVNH